MRSGRLWLPLLGVSALGSGSLACKSAAQPSPDGGTIQGDAGGGEPQKDSPVSEVSKDACPDFPGRTFQEVWNVFDGMGCKGSGCHIEGMGSFGADLRMDTVVEGCSNLVNVPAKEDVGKGDRMRVKPGDLDASYLWCKLNGTTCGTQEPRGRAPIASFYTDVIKDWIMNGAHCPSTCN